MIYGHEQLLKNNIFGLQASFEQIWTNCYVVVQKLYLHQQFLALLHFLTRYLYHTKLELPQITNKGYG